MKAVDYARVVQHGLPLATSAKTAANVINLDLALLFCDYGRTLARRKQVHASTNSRVVPDWYHGSVSMGIFIEK